MKDNTPLYNSRIIKNYVEYLKSYHPDIDIASLLNYAGIETYQLDDEGHWLSQEQVDRFHEMLAEKTDNPDISREVGRYYRHFPSFRSFETVPSGIHQSGNGLCCSRKD